MDLKKKMKAFFTLDRHASDGFTLVELIVVIAILAILGGVAVPAYGGYVKKAEMAADEALLAEVNLAFASACAINGENYQNRTDKPAIIFAGRTVAGIQIVEKIALSFGDFFESDSAEFKQMDISELMYDGTLGGFRLAGEVTLTYTSNGTKYTLNLSEKDVDAFMNSVFSELGTEYLLGEMDNVVLYASDYERLLTNVRNEDEFQEICKRFNGYPTGAEATDKSIQMQALVLYTAGRYETLDRDELYNNIIANNGGYIAKYGTDGEDFAANAAMYSLGLAYANSDAAKAAIDGVAAELGQSFDASNPDHIRALMTYCPEGTDKYGQGTGVFGPNQFITWLTDNEAEAKQNLDGFGAAMGMLTDNNGNLDYEAILNGGYGAGELASILGGTLNKNN